MHNRQLVSFTSKWLLPLVVATNPVYVQAASEASQDIALEEIVVTAQKRVERLLDIPIAVSAFNTGALEAANISNGMELQRAVPTLTLTTSASGVLPFLRGIGNPATSNNNEPSVAMYVDGVYYPRLPNAMFNLNNVQRVEVLKGPQGTLFGRNAVGGLIQIITRDPSFTPTVSLKAGYGNYQTATGSIYGSTGLSDSIAADLAVQGTKQGDGWGRNVNSNADSGFENNFAARSKWLFKFGDLTSLKLSVNYQKTTTTIGFPANTYRGTIQAAPSAPAVPLYPLDFYDVRSNDGGNIGRSENYGGSVTVKHEFDFADFLSISAWHKATEDNSFDFDYTNDRFFNLFFAVKNRVASQEFQLSSKEGSAIKWTTGLYYSNIRAASEPAKLSGSLFGPNVLTQFIYQLTKSYAGFGQVTVPLGTKTNVTGGVRYSNDHLESTGHNDVQTPSAYIAAPTLPLKTQSYGKVNFKVALDQKLSQDIMTYISYGTGYKAGNFNTTTANTAGPLKPEEMKAWEAGIKSELLENRLRLNAAVYHYDIKNPQVQIRVGANFIPINAGGERSRGIELDGEALLARGLSLRFGAAWQDAEYTEFNNAPIVTQLAVNPPYGNTAFGTFDAAGSDVTRAPKFTGNAGLSYKFDTSVGGFDVSSNYAYNGGFFWTPDHQIKQNAYGLLDAQVAYQPGNSEAWRWRVWGKNLTGEQYYAYGTESNGPSGFAGAPAAPLTYGMTVEYNF